MAKKNHRAFFLPLLYILYTDNWFTSFEQYKICFERGIEMVGTIKVNRGGIPDEFKKTKGERSVRGEFYTVSTQYNNKAVYFTKWMDKKAVHILHSIPTQRGSCKRLVKEEGRWTEKRFTRPTIISAYNKGMGGTDSGDQRIAAYRSTLKTRSWIPRIFSHFLNATVVNMYIATKHYYQADKGFVPSHLRFREIVIDQFFQSTIEQNLLVPGTKHEKTLSKAKWRKEKSRRTGQHFPVSLKKPPFSRKEGFKPRSMTGSSTRNYFRGNCIICNKYTSTKCEECGVYHFIIGEGEKMTCFRSFHTKEDIFDDDSVVVEMSSDCDD